MGLFTKFSRAQRIQTLLENGRREEVKGLNLRLDELYRFCWEHSGISPECKMSKRDLIKERNSKSRK